MQSQRADRISCCRYSRGSRVLCRPGTWLPSRSGPSRRPGSAGPRTTILADLHRIPAGVIGWGYLEATPENVAFLCQPGRVNYFIYRDPRDMLISHVYFATDMYEDHGMHVHYKSLPDFGARLKVAITGIEQGGLKMVSVRQRYDGVLEWLRQQYVMCVRYEDLVEQSGCCPGSHVGRGGTDGLSNSLPAREGTQRPEWGDPARAQPHVPIRQNGRLARALHARA